MKLISVGASTIMELKMEEREIDVHFLLTWWFRYGAELFVPTSMDTLNICYGRSQSPGCTISKLSVHNFFLYLVTKQKIDDTVNMLRK